MSFNRIGVVGAGMMGSEIALVFALAGKSVLLGDREPDLAEAAMGRLAKTLEAGVARNFWQAADAATALANLKPAQSLGDYADRDFVVEAVFEDQEVKGAVFRELDRIVGAGCVLSSNTSSISISVLASYVAAERRPRFLGTHFFSPVSRMKLVEVIPAFDTDEAVLSRVMDACRDAGKEPIRVKDVVGFAVNRLLHAFWVEAVRLVEEGVATPADIDTACRLGLGHPIGPFRLMDGVTNNLTLDVQEILFQYYGERFRPRPLLKQMVKAGRNGRKAGRGWFDHSKG
jgi:3-hydroxybutyryl-CoA dehydrogenase